MKCNLDCSYCKTDHDNSLPHPPLEECLKTIDFMLEYANSQMATKIKSLKHVILNIYGGEALNHPDVVEIIKQVHSKYEKYRSQWNLTVTTTTNAIIPKRKLLDIIPLIDEFTVSYHTENTAKQKEQFFDNVLEIQKAGRRLKCVVLVHPEPEKFEDVNKAISWLTEHNVRHLPRQLDHHKSLTEFNYDSQQVKWFKKMYQNKSHNTTVEFAPVEDDYGNHDLADTGRACCGGRQLCADKNYHQRLFFVKNKFRDYYCSVDKFFLYIKQSNGNVYVNKDCKTNYQGELGPIGHLSDTKSMINQIGSTPVIKCIKDRCSCGLCAPKAIDLDTYNSIMKKYQL